MSASNYYVFIFSYLEILSSYVSELSGSGFRSILILIMSHLFASSVAVLIRGIGGGSIRAFKFSMVQDGLVEICIVVYIGGIGGI